MHTDSVQSALEVYSVCVHIRTYGRTYGLGGSECVASKVYLLHSVGMSTVGRHSIVLTWKMLANQGLIQTSLHGNTRGC